MQAERNLLVKKVFPQIRKVCAERNVNFTEVGRLESVRLNELQTWILVLTTPLDLRWGITSEESSGGEVISLCLNEVRSMLSYVGSLHG